MNKRKLRYELVFRCLHPVAIILHQTLDTLQDISMHSGALENTFGIKMMPFRAALREAYGRQNGMECNDL